jgi:hypothetical protein
MIPWDALIELAKMLIEECTESSREQQIEALRNPGPVAKYRLRRQAKQHTLTDDQWDVVFTWGKTATTPEIELLLSESWSML